MSYSYISNAHPGYIDAMYKQYQENPEGVPAGWKEFFQGFDFGMATYNEENAAEQMAMYSSNSVAS